jgi:hypothetical protein
MTGLTRLERAKLARERAQQMEARARKLEAAERDLIRRRDVARKAILGGALLAAIRSGLLSREDWDRLVWPRISETDRQRLAGWPWEPGSLDPITSAHS